MKTLSKKLAAAGAIGAAALAQLFSPLAAFADEPVDVLPNELKNVSNVSLPGFVSTIIRLIIIVGFIIAFLFLVIGGIRWVLAGGDKTKVEGARGMVIGALVGLVIIILAFVLVVFIQNFFKIDVFNPTGNVFLPNAINP